MDPVDTQQPVIKPPQQPIKVMSKKEKVITLLVIICLIFLFPFGAALMWLKTEWPLWVKIVITLLCITLLTTLLYLAVSLTRPKGTNLVIEGNSKRDSDVFTISSALKVYASHHQGRYPTGLSTKQREISSSPDGIDLCSLLVPTYTQAIPQDPSTNKGIPIMDCSNYDSGYVVSLDQKNTITVTAPHSQLNKVIQSSN